MPQNNTRSPGVAANFFVPLIHCVLWAPNSLFLLLWDQSPVL